MEKETRLAKKKDGYGYKYTELAQINEYCENNGIKYYQEIETNEINGKDYMMTYVSEDGKDYIKHKGCQIVEATLQGIKNPVQQYGSSLTYCRRYSLLMALGLSTEEDDGASCEIKQSKKVEPQEDNKLILLSKFNELVDETNQDLEKILEYYKVKSNREMTPAQLKQAINEMEKIKGQRGEE